MQQSIKVLLVDDHTVVREGFRVLLTLEGPDIEIVGEARNGHEAIQLTQQLQPEVVLMDFSMPDMDGIAATRQILTAVPATRVVIFSATHDSAVIDAAVHAGARGYVYKTDDVISVLLTIRTVRFSTATVLPPRVSPLHVGSGERGPGFTFTKREREILEALVTGCNNKTIARMLCVDEGTVKKHLSALMQKTGTANRTQLAMYVTTLGSPMGVSG